MKDAAVKKTIDHVNKNQEMQQTLRNIKNNRHKLTPQQWRTLKGQCLAGDYEGAKKGFEKILNRKQKGDRNNGNQTLRT